MKKKGFTLIELIVVIAILGVLAAILIPKFSSFSHKAHVSAIKADTKNILKIVEAYNVENKKYPEDSAGFKALVPNIKGEIIKEPSPLLFSYRLEDYTTSVTEKGDIAVYDKDGLLITE